MGITNVVATDYQGKMTLEAMTGDEASHSFEVDGTAANAIVHECQRRIDSIGTPHGERVEQVVLHWKQASDKSKPISIDKGVIEDVEPRRMVKIVCNEQMKQQMVSGNERNPFNMFFVVDAEVKRVAGKPVAYVISKIHDSDEIPE